MNGKDEDKKSERIKVWKGENRGDIVRIAAQKGDINGRAAIVTVSSVFSLPDLNSLTFLSSFLPFILLFLSRKGILS